MSFDSFRTREEDAMLIFRCQNFVSLSDLTETLPWAAGPFFIGIFQLPLCFSLFV
jgi:hypothetical protein